MKITQDDYYQMFADLQGIYKEAAERWCYIQSNALHLPDTDVAISPDDIIEEVKTQLEEFQTEILLQLNSLKQEALKKGVPDGKDTLSVIWED